ncbi:hypothetical protein LOZ80_25435 [Paenibacillus sp. HWE-109]|uniref:hypothetical protein n=1 Tax=Paenibacillus sp. HWE-109 TaxID=1306526 RepID=UPI001EE14916|nr:hypothetical protein [Paenibacillus sp. HWE-109]UKS24931.1 hypothetical protein LOZ80_25435 [Paenibacillus sp. HWE-109]
MTKDTRVNTNVYTRPMVLSQQPVYLEPAYRWNQEQDKVNQPFKGDEAMNHPNLDPTFRGLRV